MRVSREEALASRRRITQQAARLMREKGISATSVADVMSAAGMTTGGFYKHFRSKDELAAAALREAFDSILTPLERNAEKTAPAAARTAYLNQYLSEGHIRTPGKGCPVAAMGADCGREADLLGAEFARGVEGILSVLSAGDPAPAGRAALIRQLTSLVGSVIIARAVGEGPLRDEILAAAAKVAESGRPGAQ